MNLTPPVSVIVVSQKRPTDLRRMLTSLRFLTYPAFEVIVVSDTDPHTAFPDLWHVNRIRYVPFHKANISAARNAGLAQAAGEIVAFCDDDAIPESSWLDHLIAPFVDPGVGAAGGYVRGRNGISFQWKGRAFDRAARHIDLRLDGTKPRVFCGTADLGIKTEGTNCAFRHKALQAVGGFDDSYVYYLDETDLNFRLGAAGWKTAIVPLAQVHHGYAANAVRAENRVPLSLYEIGASKGHFLARCPAVANVAAVEFKSSQRNRLINFMLRGDIEPSGVTKLLRTLSQGLADGQNRKAMVAICKPPSSGMFSDFQNGEQTVGSVCFAGSWRQKSKLAEHANTAISDGWRVTILRFSKTTLLHQHQFTNQGYWLQTGGLFGRSERLTRTTTAQNLKARAKQELGRIDDIRPIERVIYL